MSHPANLLGALKEAYLTKCGGSHKSWKLRWFVLTKDVLYYFDKELSTQPICAIQLKDYCKCKGMEGNAFGVTGKQNSFFLEMPYRIFKIFASDWRMAEEWAEAISNIGDFISKKEEMRNATPYQQAILTNAGDVINYGSSLIHWFKLLVDTTTVYKRGMRSIYNSAIYDLPRELGRNITTLAREALNAIASPRSPALSDKMKAQAQKVSDFVDKAVSFVTCCAETHKSNFNSDLEVVRRGLSVLLGLKPTNPYQEISQATETLMKAAYTLCQNQLSAEHNNPMLNDSSDSKTPLPTLSSAQKQFSTVVDSNVAFLKTKSLPASDNQLVQLVQSCHDKTKAASSALSTLSHQGALASEVLKVNTLYGDINRNSEEILSMAQKLFRDVHM